MRKFRRNGAAESTPKQVERTLQRLQVTKLAGQRAADARIVKIQLVCQRLQRSEFRRQRAAYGVVRKIERLQVWQIDQL